MNVQYLDCDELAVECEVRNITGTLALKMSVLPQVWEKEISHTIDPPIKAHAAAIKCPKREVKLCEKKLINIENQLQIMSEKQEFKVTKIAELTTGVLHIADRLNRINSSKSVTVVSTKMIDACHKLLGCLQDILAQKTVSVDMENSLKQVFDEIHYQENVETESGEDISEINPEQKHQEQINKLDQPITKNFDKPYADLTEDERLDLIADKIYRKLNLTGIPLPNNKREQLATADVEQQNLPFLSGNAQNPMNFYQSASTPSHVLPQDSNITRMPKQYLEIYNWKMVYNGDEKDELPIERFLYRVQRMALENGLSKQRLAANFSVLLKNRALNWYWEFQETYGTVEWDLLCDAMIQRFKTRRTDDDVKQSLERRKQKFKEPFLDFYHAIRSMTLSLTKPITDAELISLLNRNMRGGLQAKFAGHHFSNISEMVDQCVTVEDTWSRIGWTPEIYHQVRQRQVNELDVVENDSGNSSFHNSEQQKQSNSVCAITNHNNVIHGQQYKQQKPMFDKPYSPNACWNCFGIGHFYKDCAISIKHRFCFGCGAPNILKSQCVQCQRYQKGNSMREIRNTGVPNSQTINVPSRQVEAASNTDPELYRVILPKNAANQRN